MATLSELQKDQPSLLCLSLNANADRQPWRKEAKPSSLLAINKQPSSFHEVPARNLPTFPALGSGLHSPGDLKSLHTGTQTAFLCLAWVPTDLCVPLRFNLGITFLLRDSPHIDEVAPASTPQHRPGCVCCPHLRPRWLSSSPWLCSPDGELHDPVR